MNVIETFYPPASNRSRSNGLAEIEGEATVHQA